MSSIKFTGVLTITLLLTLSLFIAGGSVNAQDYDKFAVIYPGSIQDADYNATGYRTMQAVKEELGMEVSYSEQVAVPDAARVLSEYASSGYGIIWAHGAQFNQAVFEVAPQFPDVAFIIEADAPLEEEYENITLLERNYYPGFYVLGALATKVTETNKVGYIGGLELPFTYGEVNAIDQAFDTYKPEIEFKYIYVGDFNDPVKTKQSAEALISQGVDVIISGVNLGNYGLFRAVQNAERDVYVTTTYTDKHNLAPEHHLTSDLFRYNPVVFEAIDRIKSGQTNNFIPMQYGPERSRYLKLPVDNVSDEVNEWVKGIAEKVANGEIKVEKNLSEIDVDGESLE
ncbi:MAG: BMP family protein [Halanaerobiales bacterium]|nr:BMP family protein [Halanaerobiales bacterium]